MEIAKLGEFGLIDRLTKDIKPQNASTKYGVGDDCAVLHYPDSEVLVTTDMLMEGVHFDLTYIDLEHLGYKSAMVNISDIFAMNGTPRQMTVSLALSKRFSVEDLEAFYSGLRLACDKWNVDIVGGDTTSSYTGLAISITCIGEARKEDIVYRNGAKETDLICVSGDLGAAYMGLQLLEREKAVYYEQVNELQKKIAEAKANGDSQKLSTLNSQLSTIATPDFAGKEYLIQRQIIRQHKYLAVIRIQYTVCYRSHKIIFSIKYSEIFSVKTGCILSLSQSSSEFPHFIDSSIRHIA